MIIRTNDSVLTVLQIVKSLSLIELQLQHMIFFMLLNLVVQQI